MGADAAWPFAAALREAGHEVSIVDCHRISVLDEAEADETLELLREIGAFAPEDGDKADDAG